MPSLPPKAEPEPSRMFTTMSKARWEAMRTLAGDHPNNGRTVILTALAVAGASRAPGIWGMVGAAAAALLGLDILSRRVYAQRVAGPKQGQEV